MTILQLRKLYSSADFYATDKIKAYSVHTEKPNELNELASSITYLNIEL